MMAWEGKERRKHLRADFPCKILVGSPVRLLASHTSNISEGGLGVFLEEKLAKYTIVGLELYVEKGRPLKCKGRVIWINEAVNPLEREAVMYETGIEFTDIGDYDREYIGRLVRKISSSPSPEE